MSESAVEVAMRELIDAFPDVPPGLLATVLFGFMRVSETMADAIAASHVRIATSLALR